MTGLFLGTVGILFAGEGTPRATPPLRVLAFCTTGAGVVGDCDEDVAVSIMFFKKSSTAEVGASGVGSSTIGVSRMVLVVARAAGGTEGSPVVAGIVFFRRDASTALRASSSCLL